MSVTLSDQDAAFLAARLQRLFRRFKYPLPLFAETSDAGLIGVAGTCIGGLLTMLEAQPAPVAPSDGWITAADGLSRRKAAPDAAVPMVQSPSVMIRLGGSPAPAPQPSLLEKIKALQEEALAQGITVLFATSEGDTSAPAPQTEQAGMTQDEKKLRRMLCLRVAGPLAYMDDGEAQDSTQLPFIDFLRDSADEIERKLGERLRAARKE